MRWCMGQAVMQNSMAVFTRDKPPAAFKEEAEQRLGGEEKN